MSASSDIGFRFKLENGFPATVGNVLKSLGWTNIKSADYESDDWHLYWKSGKFVASEYDRVEDWQRMNHFPHSSCICKKDALLRNLRTLRAAHGKIFDFFPESYVLPSEYAKFGAAYRSNPESTIWICKPAGMSRGRNIFLLRDISDVMVDKCYVVQKYIDRPLTVSGYKMDLRVYVLVTSVHPLRAWLFHDGLVRFGTEKYDSTMSTDLDNLFSHLTNSSINKGSATYSHAKEGIGTGCKWTIAQLRAWFTRGKGAELLSASAARHGATDPGAEAIGHDELYRQLWDRIRGILICTLLVLTQHSSTQTPSCFELFGFDVLIDEDLHPWLIEVNSSPALGTDCAADEAIKPALVRDTMEVLQHDATNQDMFTFAKRGPTKRTHKLHHTETRPSSRSVRRGVYRQQAVTAAGRHGAASQRRGAGRRPIYPLGHEPSGPFVGPTHRRGMANISSGTDNGAQGREKSAIKGFYKLFPFSSSTRDMSVELAAAATSKAPGDALKMTGIMRRIVGAIRRAVPPAVKRTSRKYQTPQRSSTDRSAPPIHSSRVGGPDDPGRSPVHSVEMSGSQRRLNYLLRKQAISREMHGPAQARLSCARQRRAQTASSSSSSSRLGSDYTRPRTAAMRAGRTSHGRPSTGTATRVRNRMHLWQRGGGGRVQSSSSEEFSEDEDESEDRTSDSYTDSADDAALAGDSFDEEDLRAMTLSRPRTTGGGQRLSHTAAWGPVRSRPPERGIEHVGTYAQHHSTIRGAGSAISRTGRSSPADRSVIAESSFRTGRVSPDDGGSGGTAAGRHHPFPYPRIAVNHSGAGGRTPASLTHTPIKTDFEGPRSFPLPVIGADAALRTVDVGRVPNAAEAAASFVSRTRSADEM